MSLPDDSHCILCGEKSVAANCFALLGTKMQYTQTPLQNVVEETLKKSISPDAAVCKKCYELLSEKDRLLKLSRDMDVEIQNKIQKAFSCEASDDHHCSERPAVSLGVSKECSGPRRARKKRIRPGIRRRLGIAEAPPLMINERVKRKQSPRLSEYLQVMKGEKEFYIDCDSEGSSEPEAVSKAETKLNGNSETSGKFGTQEANSSDSVCVIKLQTDISGQLTAYLDADFTPENSVVSFSDSTNNCKSNVNRVSNTVTKVTENQDLKSVDSSMPSVTSQACNFARVVPSASSKTTDINSLDTPFSCSNAKKNFPCTKCDRSFSTLRGVEHHVTMVHIHPEPLECHICHRSCNSFTVLERHLKNEHDQDPLFYCEICDSEFVLEASLQHHASIAHFKYLRTKGKMYPRIDITSKSQKYYQCCDSVFPSTLLYKSHCLSKHKQPRYRCSCCEFRATSCKALERHMASVHRMLDLNLFSCVKCESTFRDPSELEEHYIKVHLFTPHIPCVHCGKKFCCNEMLRYHKSSHYAFTCELCSQGFMKKETFDFHIKRFHPNSNHDYTTTTFNESHLSSDSKASSSTGDDVSALFTESKLLTISSDGSVDVTDTQDNFGLSKAKDVVIFCLQQTKDGSIEEVKVAYPIKGIRNKDLPRKINCPICNKLLTSSFMKIHLLSHSNYGSLPYKCHICSKAYSQGTLLRKHMRSKHYEEFLKMGTKNPKRPKIKCEFCDNIYEDIYQLEEHLWVHMKEKKFSCTECNIKFGMESTFREHFKRHYFHLEKSCPVCSRPFKSVGFYQEHVNRCKNKWKCELCGTVCETQSNYYMHKKREHDPDATFYHCSHCGKSFASKVHYSSHLISHSSEKAYACNICGKKFKREKPLSDHVSKVHGKEKPFCTRCSREFSTNAELVEHEKDHWLKYRCPKCTLVYTSELTLNNHLNVHHITDNTHPVTCDTCSLTFVLQSSYKDHIVTHHPESPFICQVSFCHKLFKTESLLRDHTCQNHANLDFMCHVCYKKFSLDSDLLKHMPIHEKSNDTRNCSEVLSASTAYECCLCKFTCGNCSQILSHLIAKHSDKSKKR